MKKLFINLLYNEKGFNLFDTIRTNSPFVFRINSGMSNNVILQSVCEERGWQEFKDTPKEKTELNYYKVEREIYEDANWNLWWSYKFFQSSPYRTLKVCTYLHIVQ